jgi:polyisoprenoid-binding protein YceI
MKKITSLLLSSITAFTLYTQADELIIDNSHSEVGFSIKHMMISNVKGKFNSYDAEIDYDLDKKVFNSLEATIDPKSIDTGIEKRDDHLRSSDFFDVEKYPQMTFTMKSYKADEDEGVMVGVLTLHGITKEVKLDVTVNGTIVDNTGNTKVGFTFEGKINRKDFGLTWNKLIETGGIAVGEKVKITIELETLVM